MRMDLHLCRFLKTIIPIVYGCHITQSGLSTDGSPHVKLTNVQIHKLFMNFVKYILILWLFVTNLCYWIQNPVIFFVLEFSFVELGASILTYCKRTMLSLWWTPYKVDSNNGTFYFLEQVNQRASWTNNRTEQAGNPNKKLVQCAKLWAWTVNLHFKIIPSSHLNI